MVRDFSWLPVQALMFSFDRNLRPFALLHFDPTRIVPQSTTKGLRRSQQTMARRGTQRRYRQRIGKSSPSPIEPSLTAIIQEYKDYMAKLVRTSSTFPLININTLILDLHHGRVPRIPSLIPSCASRSFSGLGRHTNHRAYLHTKCARKSQRGARIHRHPSGRQSRCH